VIALLIVAAIFVLIMRSKQADALQPLGYVLAVVLFALLGWHSVKIVGAINLKNKCSEVITFIDSNIGQSADADSQNSYSNLPLVATISQGVEPTAQVVRSKVVSFRSELSSSIRRSVVYAVIFIVISLFIVPYTVEQTRSAGRDRRNVSHKSASRYRRRR
jgi:hypothetical protein